jgi:transposase
MYICPDCGAICQPDGGCWFCPNCGWSLCGIIKWRLIW